jgi:hypothetical protein
VLGELPAQPDAVEDVVAQDQRDRFVPDEVGADQKRLGDALGAGLRRVGHRQAPLAAVAEQPLELALVVRRGDHEDLPDAGHHQRAQRVVDHGLVEYRHELLGHRPGDGPQPGAGTAGEQDSAHSP